VPQGQITASQQPAAKTITCYFIWLAFHTQRLPAVKAGGVSPLSRAKSWPDRPSRQVRDALGSTPMVGGRMLCERFCLQLHLDAGCPLRSPPLGLQKPMDATREAY